MTIFPNSRSFFWVIIWLFPLALFGQNRTISGFVTDADSGEKLYGVRVYDTISKQGSLTNEYGFYSLTLPDQDAVLKLSGVGLSTLYVPVEKGVTTRNIAHKNNVQRFSAVEVSTLKRSTEETNAGVLDLPLSKVEKLPALMGERDVLKVLQLMPGVNSGSEGTSGIYVRGGGPDQNLMLLDGVPIYNVSHLFGFFSVFNSDALSSVKLYKGGFPARYGGRASSVLDMRLKEGNLKEYKAEASIGLLSSKLLVEGPIKKDKTAFIVSARRTYADVIARPFMDKEDGGKYYFYDANIKVHHKVNDRHHLYLSGYLGKDRASINETYVSSKSGIDFGWGNTIGALRWNYRVKPKLFMNTTVSYSHYALDIAQHETAVISENYPNNWSKEFAFTSQIRDWSGKVDFTYIPNTKNYIKFGVGDTYHTFSPGVAVFTQNNDAFNVNESQQSNTQFAHELFAYIENDHQILPRLKINYGVHFSSFFVGNSVYNEWQPRLNGNLSLTENTSLKFTYARTAQFLPLINNNRNRTSNRFVGTGNRAC